MVPEGAEDVVDVVDAAGAVAQVQAVRVLHPLVQMTWTRSWRATWVARSDAH